MARTAKSKYNKVSRNLFYHYRFFLLPIAILLGLAIACLLAFELSPWPGALLVRITFNHSDHQTFAALEKHSPHTPITIITDQHYAPHDHSALFDVYIPQSAMRTGQTLPVIVWTHGGAWVSGSKTDDSPYFKLLAARGFVVVSLSYTLAPEKTYPAQIFELNKAHAYITSNASRFHIDPNKIFLAGDSAGAQLTSQMDALITNQTYAKEVGIKPALHPSQLAGTILFCGIYTMKGLTEADPNLPKIVNWGDNEVVWAFSGTRNDADPVIRQMSPYYYATKDFPATFISGGNGDPLTNQQSMPLASKLTALGVSVTALFYPKDHQPSLPHEYQFNLDTVDGQQAFTRTVQFLQKVAE